MLGGLNVVHERMSKEADSLLTRKTERNNFGE